MTTGLAPHPFYAPTVPHQAFMIFQCMFTVITPALITGAFAERMRFGPLSAALIGTLAGAGCYLGILIKNKFGYDDSFDVVGIHGVGEVIGLLCVGLLASSLVNPGGANGLFFGNPAQLVLQLLAILVTMAYSFIGTYILLKLVDQILGLRLTESDEIQGLDLSQHKEVAYEI